MTLQEYLKELMAEKKLTAKDIERNSNGEITDSYIGQILKGQAKNVSTKKILALAKGLDVDPGELLKINAGLTVKRELWTPHSLLRAIETLVSNSDLAILFQALMKQKPAKIRAMLNTLESDKD
jgi:transcriptional regulator with XRE-family HTH domain